MLTAGSEGEEFDLRSSAVAFERVARLSEIPADGGLCVEMGGREIGLYRVGSQVVAMENTCPHAGFPLHEGLFDGRIVICSGHGWEYDVCTGLAPGVSGGEPLERYAVRVEGDEVWVDPSRTLTPPERNLPTPSS